MTDLSTPMPNVHFFSNNKPALGILLAFALALFADWLFYGERIGISAVAFAIALACGAVIGNFSRLDRTRLRLAGLIIVVGIIPAAEEFNPVSFAFIVVALGIGLLLTTNRKMSSTAEHAAALCDLYLTGPFRLLLGAIGAFNLPVLLTGFAVWFIPMLLGSVFIALFASANPVLEKWIGLLNPGAATSAISMQRVLFWVAALSLVWPFVHARWRRKAEATVAPPPLPAGDQDEPAGTEAAIDFFGAATILRSLILFNLLFAVQTVLDATYLWGNVALPADITYASYAHRGAYPLILTALLAAGFVLVAMPPGGPAERSGIIRPLVYVWVAQNVLLVASSILRLDLYVQIYLLTW